MNFMPRFFLNSRSDIEEPQRWIKTALFVDNRRVIPLDKKLLARIDKDYLQLWYLFPKNLCRII